MKSASYWKWRNRLSKIGFVGMALLFAPLLIWVKPIIEGFKELRSVLKNVKEQLSKTVRRSHEDYREHYLISRSEDLHVKMSRAAILGVDPKKFLDRAEEELFKNHPK